MYEPKRFTIRVTGYVQGVGFRPHVYVQAIRYGLEGWVCNDAEGVLIEVQGRQLAIDAFLADLRAKAPPLSRIYDMQSRPIAPLSNSSGFAIVESRGGEVRTSIIPDANVCDGCLRELFDPSDRRYQYPFLNCTHCGPRYTITKRLPYDRPQTSMAHFPMCSACGVEYHDPLDRRFHAQPTACGSCGPQLSHSLKTIVASIKEGKILALKGLGGFHLVCDATNESAVARLRLRKQRDAKPFAVMAANVVSARGIATIDLMGEDLLRRGEAPIVLLPQFGDLLAPSVAPRLATVGVLLPYTPLHHLLFFTERGAPLVYDWTMEPSDFYLVMTSANLSGEPLVVDNCEAVKKLSSIADLIVTHDRDIVVRADDSVVMPGPAHSIMVRRARGFVPQALRLEYALPSIAAFGADLKNTLCLVRDKEAFVSQHIGDLDNAASWDFLQETYSHLKDILNIVPEVAVCDLHPDFLSTRAAQATGLPLVQVQHHHAHVAAVVAEQRVCEPVVGLVLDGFGYGIDGGAWGGELLLVNGHCCSRLGHFSSLALPGGDAASREPWRMAAAALHALGKLDSVDLPGIETLKVSQIRTLLGSKFKVPTTSSCGRWFDAVAGLLGICSVSHYEGEAPMILESLAKYPRIIKDAWNIHQDGTLDLFPLFNALIGMDAVSGAQFFHGSLAAALVAWVDDAVCKTGCNVVVLAGGCFLNRVLLNEFVRLSASKSWKFFLPSTFPPGDGAISLGQALIAGSALKAGVVHSTGTTLIGFE